MEALNNLFKKITESERREFLIKNIMKDKLFKRYHEDFDSDFITYIYPKEEQEKKIQQKENNLFFIKCNDNLNNYKESIYEFLAQESRQKDLYYDVAGNIEQIEKLAKSDKINIVNNKNISIAKLILEFYDDNNGLIDKLDHNKIKMTKTIKLLAKNKNIDKKLIEDYENIFEETDSSCESK
jgi:molecular chaperone GrpE (heat shock protein)